MTVSSDAVVDGRYDVREVIGTGGMGEVRRARDLRLDRDVAIKFLRPDLAAQTDARRRFEDEAVNAARLNHPNVVVVLDSGEHEGKPYLVMECLPGHSLRDELRDRGPLDEARATWIGRDVLAALAAAHEIGLVHRDVSPANILLTDTGVAKLADFGISKTIDAADTTMGIVLGTPKYLAPERLRGDPATPASDVFAFGVTMREAGLDSVDIARATDADPQQRPTAAQLLAAFDGSDDLGLQTAAVPLVTAAVPVTGDETAAISAVADPTVAVPLAARSRWRSRNVQVVAVAVAVLVGALLLVVTNSESPSTSVDTTTDETSPVPTTIAPIPTTFAPIPSVRAEIRERAPAPTPKKRGGDAKRKRGR